MCGAPRDLHGLTHLSPPPPSSDRITHLRQVALTSADGPARTGWAVGTYDRGVTDPLHTDRYGPSRPAQILGVHGLTGHGRRWETLSNDHLPEFSVLEIGRAHV